MNNNVVFYSKNILYKAQKNGLGLICYRYNKSTHLSFQLFRFNHDGSTVTKIPKKNKQEHP